MARTTGTADVDKAATAVNSYDQRRTARPVSAGPAPEERPTGHYQHTPETGRFSRFKSQTALEDRATLNPAPPPTVAIRIQGQPDQYPPAG